MKKTISGKFKIMMCILCMVSMIPAVSFLNIKPAHASGSINILMIGNSLTYEKWVNANSVNYLSGLIKGSGRSCHIEVIAYSKEKMQTYANSNTSRGKEARQTISSRQWDYIILQQNTDWAMADPEGSLNAFRIITNYIRGNCPSAQILLNCVFPYGKTIINACDGKTWNRKQQRIGLAISYEKAAAAIGVRIVYSGETNEKVWDNVAYPYIADANHPNQYGAFGNACAIYKTIFDESPTHSSYNGGLSSSAASAIKKLAANTDGTSVSGWVRIQGNWYYRMSTGDLPTGWKKIGKYWYYFDSNNVMATSWQEIDDGLYYMKANGIMTIGWLEINDKWYYFSPKDGTMQKGWVKPGNVWYYLNENGEMVTGWNQIGDSWYYFNSEGAMKTGWIKPGRVWYYLDDSGIMTTGWQEIDGDFYYFNSEGAMKTGWLQIDADWYYFNPDGIMQKGWIKPARVWYYLDGFGKMLTGLQEIDGELYYFNNNGGMETGSFTIDGVEYLFDESGKAVQIHVIETDPDDETAAPEIPEGSETVEEPAEPEEPEQAEVPEE